MKFPGEPLCFIVLKKFKHLCAFVQKRTEGESQTLWPEWIEEGHA